MYKKLPLLTHKELCKLVKKAQKGNKKARNTVIEHNVGMCVKAVNNFMMRCNIRDFSQKDDLIQEAILGLFKAVAYFDESRGCTFSTYAMNWIFQGMQRYWHNNNSLIRVPVHAQEVFIKFNKLKKEDDSHNDEFYIRVVARELGRTVDSMRQILKYNRHIFFSLDDSLDNIELSYVSNNVEIMSKYNVSKLFTYISDREQYVIKRRLNDETLFEIGEDMGICRERVRQIQESGLRKLKALVASNQIVREDYF